MHAGRGLDGEWVQGDEGAAYEELAPDGNGDGGLDGLGPGGGGEEGAVLAAEVAQEPAAALITQGGVATGDGGVVGEGEVTGIGVAADDGLSGLHGRGGAGGGSGFYPDNNADPVFAGLCHTIARIL